MANINRRNFIKLGLTAGSLLALGNDSKLITKVLGSTSTFKKVIILGLDGMDPKLVDILIKQGKLPAFQKLRSIGDFRKLRTSIPPQSPVAWSNFISGANPGGHGIFDFVHRDVKTYIPKSSASETSGAKKTLRLGDTVFPLSKEQIHPVRKGKAFWQVLEEHDIPATVFKMPGNYPPAETKQRTLTGMGTPDIIGTFGTFNFYTNEPKELQADIGGGKIHEVYVIGNRVEARLPGPENVFKRNKPDSYIDFKVFIDPEYPVAKIVIQDNEFILNEGEWSGWKPVSFNMIPTQSVKGNCLFFLKQVHPKFKLYISPINIDPGHPALPVATPENYGKELKEKFGPFYTQGLPADTNALDHGVLDDEEFLQQDDIVLRERLEMFDYELSRFESGLLFYYLSSTDQRQHMFWRLIDKEHPSYDPKLASKFGKTIENIYREADKILDKSLQKADKDTILMVMSDHGFAPFKRSFNVNTWLKEAGYHSLYNERKQGESSLFYNTDWSRTQAYSYGLNSVFINQRGREAQGIVNPGSEKENLVREIAKKLEQYKDPKTGKKVVLSAFVAKDVYSGQAVEEAPDIILGFNSDYRISWASPLGRLPKNIIENNKEKWSGDHCAAPQVVPGILFCNRKIKSSSPALYDLTATILKIFNIDKPKQMIGKPIF